MEIKKSTERIAGILTLIYMYPYPVKLVDETLRDGVKSTPGIEVLHSPDGIEFFAWTDSGYRSFGQKNHINNFWPVYALQRGRIIILESRVDIKESLGLAGHPVEETLAWLMT